MLGVRTRIIWDHAKVAAIVSAMPAAAHQVSAAAAAEAAAARIGGSGSGALAADVRQPKPLGRYRSLIGSSLPYARIEHFGGVIEARNEDAYGRRLLYIRPGDIVATAPSVVHQGKRYLDVATTVYVQTMPAGLRRFFPR
jgi:hypothetical protein